MIVIILLTVARIYCFRFVVSCCHFDGRYDARIHEIYIAEIVTREALGASDSQRAVTMFHERILTTACLISYLQNRDLMLVCWL